MASPYDDLDSIQRWSTTAASIADGTYDPQGPVKFTIGEHDSIASAGSCFAARIAERLRLSTNAYYTAEPAPAWLSPDEAREYGYVPFSARYGLVFGALQLAQLFDRATGTFVPVESAWRHGTGYVDPFRPRISPEPYSSVEELEADRAFHLAAVRSVFERATVFVFTLGLTETWCDRRDGSAYPICPGIAGGSFDANIHGFRNLGFAENYRILNEFIAKVRSLNPDMKFIFTVSPVPLGATMEAQHVVRATTYSKSVLRAVAEELSREHDFVDYFASYEMASQAFAAVDPFEEDRRHIAAGCSDRIVDTFCKHYLASGAHAMKRPSPGSLHGIPQLRVCDEDLFAR